MAALLSLILALASSSPALKAAEKHLREGKVEELSFDLADGVPLAPGEASAAAQLLADGAAAAAKQGDATLAYQLAQTAHRRDPRQAEALRTLAELSLADRAFTEADSYGDALAAVAPSDERVALLRARIAAAEEDWGHAEALSKPLLQSTSLSSDEREEATSIHARAAGAVAPPVPDSAAPSPAEAQIHAAAEVAARERAEALAAPVASKQSQRDDPVVMYVATTRRRRCATCLQARSYFASHHLRLIEKNVDRDPQAAEELRRKATAANFTPRTYPILDVHGSFLEGFNPDDVEWALSVGNKP